MSWCGEGQLWTGAWNEVAHEKWVGVSVAWEEGSILVCETRPFSDRVGESRGKGKGRGKGGLSCTFRGLGRGAGARQLPR